MPEETNPAKFQKKVFTQVPLCRNSSIALPTPLFVPSHLSAASRDRPDGPSGECVDGPTVIWIPARTCRCTCAARRTAPCRTARSTSVHCARHSARARRLTWLRFATHPSPAAASARSVYRCGGELAFRHRRAYNRTSRARSEVGVRHTLASLPSRVREGRGIACG